MIRNLFAILLVAALNASASEYIRATLTVTNSTTTNDAFTVNGSTRRGAGTRTSTTWITNTSPMVTATNIFSQLGAFKPSAVVSINLTASNVITLEGIGLTMTASNFASLVLETNSASVNPWTFMLPSTAFPASVIASNGSALIPFINASTNPVSSNATAMAHFVSLQGTQTMANKTLTAPAIHGGSISNAALTNVTGTLHDIAVNNAIIQGLQTTNPITWGNLYIGNIISGIYNAWALQTATNAAGEQIFQLYNDDLLGSTFAVIENAGATRTMLNNLPTDKTTNYGSFFAHSVATPSAAVGSLTVQTNLTATNLTVGGSNYWHGDLSITPRTFSSLINGDNTDLPIGTNASLYLSGATTTANIHGFVEGRESQWMRVRVNGATAVVLYNESGTETISAARKLKLGTGGTSTLTMTNQPQWWNMEYTSASGSARWEIREHSN